MSEQEGFTANEAEARRIFHNAQILEVATEPELGDFLLDRFLQGRSSIVQLFYACSELRTRATPSVERIPHLLFEAWSKREAATGSELSHLTQSRLLRLSSMLDGLYDQLKALQNGSEAAVDVSHVLFTAGDNLPSFLEVDGRGIVMVDAAEYRELVAARSKLLRQAMTAPAAPAKAPRLGLSTIERDTEVAEWLRERFQGGISAAQLHADCLERFGAERTPSVDRIARFRQAARRGR